MLRSGGIPLCVTDTVISTKRMFPLSSSSSSSHGTAPYLFQYNLWVSQHGTHYNTNMRRSRGSTLCLREGPALNISLIITVFSILTVFHVFFNKSKSICQFSYLQDIKRIQILLFSGPRWVQRAKLKGQKGTGQSTTNTYQWHYLGIEPQSFID